MISFESDYIAGAHPAILKNLAETNMEALPGYGTDRYSERAKEKIKRAIGREDLDVEFLVGGTQTNSVIISSMLRDFEGVVAAETGHISVHEAGAVEYSGNKVLTVREKDGKILPEVLRTYLEGFYADGNHEHMVFPGMVYISHPTEYGTLYKKSELSELSGICREYGIPLFLDGARLGYGLMSRETDVTLADIAEYCDVFYIGGTKVGALCGEAVVFTKGNKPAHFMNSVKKRGALLAKGRLLGVQFDTLFTDDLYFEISRHAIEMTEKMKDILKAHGLHFYIASPTNQQFVVLEDSLLKKLK
ncbi:MAG: low specificity L-threonine aldolase, partial [Lachnospiraceae bacterium]|nr:low specificity L-threonine aldolase [Lachnospiraceae bacterium]